MSYLFIKDWDYNSKDNKFRIIESIWIVLLVAVMVLFIFLSMLTWSFQVYGMDRDVPVGLYFGYIQQLTRFDGIQGRYFIPIIPMLLLAFRSRGEGLSRKSHIGIMVYYLITNYYLFGVLHSRFWI